VIGPNDWAGQNDPRSRQILTGALTNLVESYFAPQEDSFGDQRRSKGLM
jgi:hypothetical protein